jgi:hypothetical protein
MTTEQPERGSPAPPRPTPPTPPTGDTPLQDHAPPEDASSGELIGEGEQTPASGDGGGAATQSPEKDVEDWATGDEPMTGPQRSYLETLAREAGEDVPADLTKAQASQLIDRLQARTGRGS